MRLKWDGKLVQEKVQVIVGDILTDAAMLAEATAKKELTKGHGVVTGTLRRSIHSATPGYSWSGDDTPAGPGSPERGGVQARAGTSNSGKMSVQFGSGLKYALPVNNGHRTFPGYHFIEAGVNAAKNGIQEIVRRHHARGRHG